MASQHVVLLVLKCMRVRCLAISEASILLRAHERVVKKDIFWISRCSTAIYYSLCTTFHALLSKSVFSFPLSIKYWSNYSKTVHALSLSSDSKFSNYFLLWHWSYSYIVISSLLWSNYHHRFPPSEAKQGIWVRPGNLKPENGNENPVVGFLADFHNLFLPFVSCSFSRR